MAFRPKILVVEDDLAMLNLLGEVLGQMGAEPHLLSNSRQAAELIEREKFDGVFLDLVMPEMGGLELARHIRRSRSNANVPLVALTASPEPTVMQDSFQAGFNFFLQKPVTVQQLRKLLTAARGLMLAERRRYQRAPVAFLVRCRWDSQQLTGQSVNVSASGMLLELPELPPRDAEVLLEFSLPGAGERLEVPGTVVRQHSASSVGIQFATTDDTRRLLADFVEKTLAALSSSL